MPSIIEILLTASDQTGPGFASARANLQSLQAALDADRARFAALGAGAQVAAQQTASSAQQAAQATQTATQATQQAISTKAADAAAGRQQAQEARTLASINQQLARTQMQVDLASTDAAGKVRILTENYERLSTAARQAGQSEEAQARASLAASRAELQLTQARNVQNRGLGPALPRTVEEFGTGALMQAGIATGAGILGQQLIQIGQQSVQLSVDAERIGIAYDAATRRAGIGADALLMKLREASRGTVTDADLQMNANKALALGVGENAQQVADLLAIARQKGKDFGEDTATAFQDITIGLGRLSPRILDNLGIILDENQIYQDYAKSIGVAAGKLSDQQKRQALVNELIKDNTGLIRKNAEEQGDAADRIARAAAQRQEAQQQIGGVIEPVYTAGLEALGNLAQNTATEIAKLQQLIAAFPDSGVFSPEFKSNLEWLDKFEDKATAGVQWWVGTAWKQLKDDLGITPILRRNAAEAKTAREDTYTPVREDVLAAVRAERLTPPARFRGFGTPISGAGVTQQITNINITNTGAVVTPANIVEDVDRALQEKARRNAFITVHHQ